MTLSISLEEILESFNDTSWDLLQIINANPDFSFKDIQKESNLSQEKCYKELCRLEGGVLIKGKRRFADKRVMGYEITIYGEEALKRHLN